MVHTNGEIQCPVFFGSLSESSGGILNTCFLDKNDGVIHKATGFVPKNGVANMVQWLVLRFLFSNASLVHMLLFSDF